MSCKMNVQCQKLNLQISVLYITNHPKVSISSCEDSIKLCIMAGQSSLQNLKQVSLNILLTETPLKNFVAVFWRTWVVLLAPFILSPLLFISINAESGEALKCAYTILLMAVYWLTEALPLPITSMIPMVLLPLLGIMSTGVTSFMYFVFLLALISSLPIKV